MMADVSLDWGLRAIRLFKEEIMPHLGDADASQAAA
jgi:hypothetical protein